MSVYKIAGCVATLLMVGAGVSAPIISNMVESVEPSPVVLNPEQVITPDPVIEETPKPVEPVTPEPTPQPLTNTEETPKERPTPPASNSPEWSDASGVTSPNDYWVKYAGLCPSQQPQDSIFWSQSRYLAFARHGDYPWPTYQHFVNTYWNFHVLYGYNDDALSISSFANMGYGDDQANRAVGLWIDYATMSIYADSLYHAEPWTSSTKPLWTEVAVEANAYLKQLDASYRAQCDV